MTNDLVNAFVLPLQVRLIYITYHVDVGETPFMVAVDFERRAVVVSIRGTLSLKARMEETKMKRWRREKKKFFNDGVGGIGFFWETGWVGDLFDVGRSLFLSFLPWRQRRKAEAGKKSLIQRNFPHSLPFPYHLPAV